jgi:hypothetical protein
MVVPDWQYQKTVYIRMIDAPISIISEGVGEGIGDFGRGGGTECRRVIHKSFLNARFQTMPSGQPVLYGSGMR